MKNTPFIKIVIGILLVVFWLASSVKCHSESERSLPQDTVECTEIEQISPNAINEYKVITYILNTNSQKIHKKICGTGARISPENRKIYKGNIEDLYSMGYTKCGNCFRGER